MYDDVKNSSNSQTLFLELLYQIGSDATSCLAHVVWEWSTYHTGNVNRKGTNARIYIDKLASLDYSQSLQRIDYKSIKKDASSKNKVTNEIVSFVCNLSYDGSFSFLIALTEKWIKTFDDQSLHSLLYQEFTDEDISRLLLKQIYYELADIEAIDLISNIHRKVSD